jgi:two-component system, sensor histidine kinase and response regulator
MENIEKQIEGLEKLISRFLPAEELVQVREYIESIKNSSSSKAYFLAMISHEIRTPMSGVIGVADLLYETQLSTKQKYLVDTIRISGESIILLLGDILEFSKLEYGNFKIDTTRFDLKECIEDTLKLFAPMALGKNISLSYDIKKGTPLYVDSDKVRLRQILVNLLSNALKHTLEGEIVITVEKRSLKKDVAEILFSIKDTGSGIPEENLDKLFKPFEQIRGNFTGQYGGTGLGLAISKKLTELLGGEIWIESKTGKGSVFHFTVKATFSNDKELEFDSYKPQRLSGSHIPTLSEKYPFSILVAEDNIINSKLILKLLENFGYAADIAVNGKEVIHFVQKKKYDIILMDIQMPEMDGYEATKIIIEKFSEQERPWIIAITANAMEDDKEKCFSAGMNDYLSKPIRKDDLYKIIEKIGESRQ